LQPYTSHLPKGNPFHGTLGEIFLWKKIFSPEAGHPRTLVAISTDFQPEWHQFPKGSLHQVKLGLERAPVWHFWTGAPERRFAYIENFVKA
jgi:hypothetical protein